MREALEEAKKGLGRTHPNPAVGAVVVKQGRVLARGFHAQAGTPHAEVVALRQLGRRAAGATLYSTLEPCNHQGRTPPCTQAIIAAGIRRVVFASSDPNPLVDGKGARALRAAGVEVVPHVLRDEADMLNRPFFKVMRTGLPWVTLKAAITLDGKIATASGDSRWISSEASRDVVHQLRDLIDGIVVGAGTVVADNPRLTTRLARKAGRNAARIVLDPQLRTRPTAKVYARGVRRIVVTGSTRGHEPFLRRGVEVWVLPLRRGRFTLEPLLEGLAEEGLLHLMVEGGAGVYEAFLRARQVDELALFVAPKLLGHTAKTWTGGLLARTVKQALMLENLQAEPVGGDLLITARLTP
ncbi:MAG: bifunctional diaminohydroxyphosphoribosylaminopyrimidine deaminase/5-amino-6-(5-phosphoribosylamino)uracil reductase RibD [Archangium sp.]|nr:bifunctional diaminohydroxyphosphoribosylaminopyrimidine deaminase/5-amino-6-(5-phosphoribosylamino)uracil reductase RibD [Archangium sp.]